MKRLYKLLKSYFNDNDIEISLENEEKEILFSINEKRYYRELRIFNRNESIFINDFDFSENEEEIELLRLNNILFEYNEEKMNLYILNYLILFIDIIE